MVSLREVVYQKNFQERRLCLLAGDIGGTNSNFGIFEIRGTTPVLLISLHAQSQEVTDYAEVVKEILRISTEKYGIEVRQGCFGVAGIIGRNRKYVKPTHLSIAVDAQNIIDRTDLEDLILINDFEAVGLGIDHINPRDLVVINKGGPQMHAQKACIGAGTGMGKAALLWNNHSKRYMPVASEGGHSDCAAQTHFESQLFAFIQAEGVGPSPVSWEHVLSGSGISKIYKFLGTQKRYALTDVSKEIEMNGFKPDLISRYAKSDQRCLDTFDVYTTFYARCAKNFVLDMLALNGIYIGGGIAAKNVELFKDRHFMPEFMRCGQHGKILEKVPVFVITDYNVSLYGAIVFMQLHQQGIL